MDIFVNNGGYLQTKEIKYSRRLQYELSALVEAGDVICLRRGLYKHQDFAVLNHWQEISLMYPKAVICSESAALYHDLTTYVPTEVHLAIGQKSRIKVEDFPPVKLYYWADKYFNHHIAYNNGVKVYNIERTVCDIIRLKSQNDMEMVKEVCRAYLNRKDHNMNTILTIAKEIDAYDRVAKIYEILI